MFENAPERRVEDGEGALDRLRREAETRKDKVYAKMADDLADALHRSIPPDELYSEDVPVSCVIEGAPSNVDYRRILRKLPGRIRPDILGNYEWRIETVRRSKRSQRLQIDLVLRLKKPAKQTKT